MAWPDPVEIRLEFWRWCIIFLLRIVIERHASDSRYRSSSGWNSHCSLCQIRLSEDKLLAVSTFSHTLRNNGHDHVLLSQSYHALKSPLRTPSIALTIVSHTSSRSLLFQQEGDSSVRSLHNLNSSSTKRLRSRPLLRPSDSARFRHTRHPLSAME